MSVYTERAAELFGKGFNCSQAVFAAFCDKFGMDEKTALKVASGLGGGVGRMREVCGAMCGAAMVAGMVYGDDTGENREAKSYTYKKVQEIAVLQKAALRSNSGGCGESYGKSAFFRIVLPKKLNYKTKKELFYE